MRKKSPLRPLRPAEAAREASAILREHGLHLFDQTNSDMAPVVSGGCIRTLIQAHKLPPGLIYDPTWKSVYELFSRTRVITTVELNMIRVSISSLGDSIECDPLPHGKARQFTGWDFANAHELPMDERRAGIEGVWPITEENLRIAARLNAWFFPSMKGFIDGSLIGKVTGYHLDLTTGKRWVHTRKPSPDELRELFHDNSNWSHLWLQIGQGPIAAASFNPRQVDALYSKN